MKQLTQEEEILKQKILALYSDEWLAVYQYSIESDFCKMLVSKDRISQKVYNQITKELDIHTNEEFQHAKLLVPELIKLGSGPISHIDLLSKKANADFLTPHTNEIITLEQSIESEQGAIDAYTDALNYALEHFKHDGQLIDTFKYILDQEYEHKEDLLKILNQI